MIKSHHSHFKGKKAFIGDVITIIIFIFVFAITILCGYLLLSRFNTQFQTSPGAGDTGKTIMQAQSNNFIGLWDGLFGVILVMMSLAAAISAYFVDTHPIVFGLTLILLAVFIITSAAIANAYAGVESAGVFADFAGQFRLMHYVMSNLVMYTLAEGALITIALFTKARQ